MRALLCVDVGNTRLKWAVMQSSIVLGQGFSPARPPSLAIPVQLLRMVEEAVVSCVGEAKMASALELSLTARGIHNVRFLVSEAFSGRITNGYAEPVRLGVDRWLAMVAAEREFGLPIVVVDAGTALTVDAVDSMGMHLGGYIVPGLRTMLCALGSATAQISIEALQALKPGAAVSNTAEAVCGGVVEAARGLVDRAVRQLVVRDGSHPQVVLTGGDRRLLLEPGSRWHVRPDLVLRGVHLVATGNTV